MSNIIANDAAKAQSRCNTDTAPKITKGMSVLRDPQLSKVRFFCISARCDAEAIIYKDQICGFYSHHNNCTVPPLHSTPGGVGKMRPVRLRLISASNNCRVKVRIWVRFRVRVRVRVGRLIQVA